MLLPLGDQPAPVLLVSEHSLASFSSLTRPSRGLEFTLACFQVVHFPAEQPHTPRCAPLPVGTAVRESAHSAAVDRQAEPGADGSFDDISGESFLRTLLSMPIERAQWGAVRPRRLPSRSSACEQQLFEWGLWAWKLSEGA